MNSSEARAAATLRQSQLTKPGGSLGRLEALAIQLAEIQCVQCPASRPAALIIFASDHPVAQLGVSAYPAEVTRAMLRNFVQGGAAASVASKYLGVSLEVVDVGVLGIECTAGTVRTAAADLVEGNLVETDAMSSAVFEAARQSGAEAVARLAPDVKVVLFGDMGIGNTTLASAVAAASLKLNAADVVGRGTGVDEVTLAKKQALVQQVVNRVGTVSPREALRRLGGREMAAIDGAAEAALKRGLAIVVDGVIVTASLLPVLLEQPTLRSHFIFSHRSADASHRAMLQALDANPLLDLNLRLGEGSGALAALPLIDLACHLHSQMATFAQAAVPEKT
jgi:nicotinate-nucleotide--dimethylbenzimidazole phosphoribosyltransferase